MNLIVIPTYNRSAKLRRVLDWYRAEKLSARIVVLDASSEPMHREANQRTVDSCAAFASRIETSEEKLVARLVAFLEGIDDELVAIGNDEDAYFPEFLEEAFAYLRRNPDYVVATGRYITSARPLFGLRRITYWTDTFLGLDVDEPDPGVRVVNFQRLNTGGVPPLYWSVRRRSAFLTSCRLGLQLEYGSAQELIDQIASCVQGKIRISDAPMLLRDESRLNYKAYSNRDTGRLYIGAGDLDRIEAIAAETWGGEVALAVRAVTSWYRAKASGESYQLRASTRSYCRFNDLASAPPSFAWLRGAIRWSCTSGVLLSQIFAYFGFLRYMQLSGRGARFRKMTRTIAVQEVDAQTG
jgi:glycosyltransferase domain-containing protein